MSPDNHTKLNKNNFSEKIFLLKSSVGKKERTQFALSALGLGGEGTGRWVEVFQEGGITWFDHLSMTSQCLSGAW